MHWGFVTKIIGILISSLGFSMVLPLSFGLYYKDMSVYPILAAMVISIFSGMLMYIMFRKKETDTLSQREGILIVAFGWTAIGAFGALPFAFSGSFASLTDAFFESVSGFTTTGSSILTNIEDVPKGLLLWRSFIQWLGGMGIIVLSIAVLPFLGVGGMQLYKAEVPSPVPDKLKPRIRDTAMILWKVYAVFSVLEFSLLFIGGMSFFDALCHTFTTLPTGGFSPKNTSVAHYDSIYFDIIVTVFMLIAGINFSLYYQALQGKRLVFWKDGECRFFLGVVLLITLLVCADVYGDVYKGIGESLRYSVFQVASIVTTTGFATADYEAWPPMSQVFLLLLMFLGGSAGSTGGGMKCLRIMLCFKFCYKELFNLIHPRAVYQIKMGGKVVPKEVMSSVLGFLALYMFVFAASAIFLAGLGTDFVTAFTSVAATLGNIGPGFGMVGPAENFSHIHVVGKWVLIFCMLLGRLEIYTLILLLVPEFWKK